MGLTYSNSNNNNDSMESIVKENTKDPNSEEMIRKEEIHNKLTKKRSYTDLATLPTVITNTIVMNFNRVINIFIIVDEDILYNAAKEGNLIELKNILESDVWGEQIEYKGSYHYCNHNFHYHYHGLKIKINGRH